MATTTLQLAVITPLDNLRNRKIESNVKDLLPIVQAKANEYKNTQYGITQERLCKEHRATLNKFQTSINDEVKAIGEANNYPFQIFKAEVQPIIDEVASAIASLDEQLNEMESLWRTNNLDNARILYNAIFSGSGFDTWIPFEKILITKKTGRTSYEDFFGNKGSWKYAEGHEDTKDVDVLMKAGTKVVEVFETLLNLAVDKVEVINSIDYPQEIIAEGIKYLSTSYDPVKRGFDVDGALARMKDIKRREEEKAAAVERAKRDAEEKARREAEEAQRRAEAEKQRAIEEERRKAEAEKQKAIEEAERKAREEERQRAIAEEAKRQKELEVKKNVNAPAPQPDEKIYTVRFEAKCTAGQARDLRMFCDSIGITLTPIK